MIATITSVAINQRRLFSFFINSGATSRSIIPTI
jgi:hypothetical protein